MNSTRTLTYATRRSALALAQSRAFIQSWKDSLGKDATLIEELLVVTSGDKNQTSSLQDIGGKGLFIKELEEALYDKRADLAVHSIKDVPAELAPGLSIACIPLREDPRDAFISHSGKTLAELPQGAKVGTSSLRRALCLKEARPDLVIEPLRGNVDTRLRKLEEKQYDAVVLALAGLKRLSLQDKVTQVLDIDLSLPAIGQGALGIETRSDDALSIELLRRLHHPETATAVACERAFMGAADGSCRLPIAAHARRVGEQMQLDGFVADPDGTRVRRGQITVSWPSSESEAAKLGAELGRELKNS